MQEEKGLSKGKFHARTVGRGKLERRKVLDTGIWTTAVVHNFGPSTTGYRRVRCRCGKRVPGQVSRRPEKGSVRPLECGNVLYSANHFVLKQGICFRPREQCNKHFQVRFTSTIKTKCISRASVFVQSKTLCPSNFFAVSLVVCLPYALVRRSIKARWTRSWIFFEFCWNFARNNRSVSRKQFTGCVETGSDVKVQKVINGR